MNLYPVKDQRLAKLMQRVAALEKRQTAVEARLENAIKALKTGLPHMNLGVGID